MVQNTSNWGKATAAKRYADGGAPKPLPIQIGPQLDRRQLSPEENLHYKIFGEVPPAVGSGSYNERDFGNKRK